MKRKAKAWLYLLPAFLFICFFMLYPLVDVCVYSVEENFNFASQSFTGYGLGNFLHVLKDPFFVSALRNTLLIVAVTVPVSTLFALVVSVLLSRITVLRKTLQTVFFLPYVTNTLAVGLVFMILFKKTDYSDGLVNAVITALGGRSVDFMGGPYWAKMLVTCIYTTWIVMPFKILVFTGAIAGVDPELENAARVDGAGTVGIFFHITLPLIRPAIFYLLITGFIGAFKAYSDQVALFGTNLNAEGMNTVVGYVYDMLYSSGGGYPSYAAAAALILFAVVLLLTVINLTVSRRVLSDR